MAKRTAKQTCKTIEDVAKLGFRCHWNHAFTRALDAVGVPAGLRQALVSAAINNGIDIEKIERKVAHHVLMMRDIGLECSGLACEVTALVCMVNAARFKPGVNPPRWIHGGSVIFEFAK